MSFVSPPQRGYESLAHSDLNQPHSPVQSPTSARVPMHPLSSFDNLPAAPPQPAAAAPSSSPVAQTSNATSDRAQGPLPKVGETRCYWALLTPDLNFLYLDPVLQSHLQEQAELLIGKSLITFVHPDEQASAKEDLGGVLDSRTLHGSVTRVRFSRLTRVRRQLGYQGPGPEWSDADKIAVDANYMAVDLVINWAADGLVLCFMHAVVDLNPRDNDEHNKTGWTNWCGTPYLSLEQVQLLYQRLYTSVPQPPSMARVFQILKNQPERELWVSWPPDPGHNQAVPNSKDFAKLAEDIEINNPTSSSTDAKTSCTRRYRATQLMDFGIDGEKEVESIFIPYGSIIFACHKVSSTSRSGINISNVGPPPSHHPGGYPPVHQHYYDPPTHSYSLPPVPHPSAYNGYPPPPHQGPYGPWSHPHEPPHGSYSPWSGQHHPMSGLSVSSVRSSAYPPQQHQWSSQPPSYVDQGPPGAYPSHPSGMPYGTPGPEDSPPSGHVVPPRGSSRRGSGTTREQYGNGGRSAGNPPVGVSRCSSCKATQSPEWRKGPSGKKDLCNACGLRYARSRAKKEGGAASRRRKDRAISMASKPSPSASPVSMSFNNGLRGGRSYDEGFPMSASSTGSASGNEMYPPSAHHAYHEQMSPSPSPPSSSMNYVPYAHEAAHSHQNNSAIDNRSSHFVPTPHTFYSVPPPLPNPAMHHMSHHNHPSSLPRLESSVGSQYGRPVSPSLPSPASPVSASPLSVSLSAASFERDRQHDKAPSREMAPSTSPTESRHGRYTP